MNLIEEDKEENEMTERIACLEKENEELKYKMEQLNAAHHFVEVDPAEID